VGWGGSGLVRFGVGGLPEETSAEGGGGAECAEHGGGCVVER